MRTKQETVEKAVAELTEKAKNLISKNNFYPIMCFLVEFDGEGIATIPMGRYTDRLLGDANVKRVINAMWNITAKILAEEKMKANLEAVVVISEAWYTTYIGDRDVPMEELEKDYTEGKVTRPSLSPHRNSALVVSVSMKDSCKINLSTIDHDDNGHIVFTDLADDANSIGGRLADLFPDNLK